MRKKICFFSLLVLVVSFFVLLNFCQAKQINDLNLKEAIDEKILPDESVNIYYDSPYGARMYFTRKYPEEYLEKIKIIRSSKFDVTGYDQGKLNEYYNDIKGIEIDGTCDIVACLEMLLYYDSIDDDFSVNDSPEDAFVKIFDACIADGSTTYTGGTKKSWVDDCVDETFNAYGSDREGNSNWYYLVDNIHDSVNSKNPIIFGMPSHGTVVHGMETIDGIFNRGTSNQPVLESKREQFVCLVTGWNNEKDNPDAFPYGIYPMERITNINDEYQVVWAEK